MKIFSVGLAVALCAVRPSTAQNETTDEPRKPRGRMAWFVSTSMPQGLENPVSIMSGTDVVQVTLSKRAPSEPVKIPEDGILRMVRKIEPPKEPGKTEYLTLAQATIPETVDKALVILVPVEKNPQGRLFQAKIQNLASFSGGDSLYLNLTNVKVGVEMGKTKLEIKPGEVSIYDAPNVAEPLEIPLRYSYFNPVKQQWQVLSASTIVLYPTRREICIFSWDPRFKRVDYHGITFPVS
jgi:hypothetical protein